MTDIMSELKTSNHARRLLMPYKGDPRGAEGVPENTSTLQWFLDSVESKWIDGPDERFYLISKDLGKVLIDELKLIDAMEYALKLSPVACEVCTNYDCFGKSSMNSKCGDACGEDRTNWKFNAESFQNQAPQ